MIKKTLLAATVASGLIVPAQAGVYLPPKPAIIKPENIEFSKNLLAMPFTMGMLPGKAVNGITLVNRDTTGVNGTNSASTLNFANCPIGAASSTRYVIALVHYANQTTIRNFSSATIGGVSATNVLIYQPSGTSGQRAAIFGATVPSGTTATVVVTLSGTANGASRCWCIALDNLNSTTALSTNTAIVATGVLTGGVTLNFQQGGYGIHMAFAVSSVGSWSAWDQFTERFDGIAPNNTAAWADGFPTFTNSSQASNVTYSSSARSFYNLGASWR